MNDCINGIPVFKKGSRNEYAEEHRVNVLKHRATSMRVVDCVVCVRYQGAVRRVMSAPTPRWLSALPSEWNDF